MIWREMLAVILAQAAVAAQEESWYPLAKGTAWVYRTDYDPDTDIIHEVTGTEKVGETDCFVVEHKSHNEKEQRTRSLRKEWLAAGAEGLRIHKMQRGPSEMPVEKPFFKLKAGMKKDEEWSGEAKAGEATVQHEYLVEEEGEVEVPAGKYRARKVRVRIRQGDTHSAEAFEWYAKGVGLVKSELTIRARGETFVVVYELKEVRKAK